MSAFSIWASKNKSNVRKKLKDKNKPIEKFITSGSRGGSRGSLGNSDGDRDRGKNERIIVDDILQISKVKSRKLVKINREGGSTVISTSNSIPVFLQLQTASFHYDDSRPNSYGFSQDREDSRHLLHSSGYDGPMINDEKREEYFDDSGSRNTFDDVLPDRDYGGVINADFSLDKS